jgi:hypothetical protein
MEQLNEQHCPLGVEVMKVWSVGLAGPYNPPDAMFPSPCCSPWRLSLLLPLGGHVEKDGTGYRLIRSRGAGRFKAALSQWYARGPLLKRPRTRPREAHARLAVLFLR